MDYKRAVISPYREFEKHSQDLLVSLGKLQQEPLIGGESCVPWKEGILDA